MQRPIEKINLEEKFGRISEPWSPRIAAEVGDQLVKLVKLRGEFVWHHHENEDELFLVVRGRLTIRLRERDIHLGPGEFVVVPRGVEHLPVANEEAWVLLFEPKSTLNTGNVHDERTVAELDWV